MANLTKDFNAAIQFSYDMRDSFLIPHFYKIHSLDGRFVCIDKSSCSMILQKRLAVDTIVQSKNGGSVCFEEKIEQFPENGRPRKNFALETDSCTVPGHESLGWMHYAKADYLLYCFALPGHTGLNAYLINFPKLREWFWHLSARYPSHIMPLTTNHTRFEMVPIIDVQRAVPTDHYLIDATGCQLIKRRSL